MPALKFTVDSALLEELGERLVGEPYIALAELVKNSYDADATKVTIELQPGKCIKVTDNGHGMDFQEFKDFWMRVGSTHKRGRISRHLKRPMTGSKGVGRLAAQYLAKELSLGTISERNLRRKLEAHVNWEVAVKAGDLTEATVNYTVKAFKKPLEQGTSIVLVGLKQKWDAKLVEGLAREIWSLQPPFRSNLAVIEDRRKAFEIEFLCPKKEYIETFNRQTHAILNIWHAKLVGKNDKGSVSLSLQFAGEEPVAVNYRIENCKLRGANFELRIYHLVHRQPYGIKVNEAREYLKYFGGVRVYDGGFHLPYYGDPKNDWLEVEFDHSHRLSVSRLLPKELQVKNGMTFLPTLSRILGVVNVNTSQEQDLDILITRDRLQGSAAFENLRNIVRYALDFYATREAKRSFKRELEERETKLPKIQMLEDVLEKHRPEIPNKTYRDLLGDLRKASKSIETEAEITARQVEMMGPLATAGISSLAYQHELKQQFSTIHDIVRQIGEIETSDQKLQKTLNELKETLSSWVKRAEATNALFSYFGDAESLRTKRRFLAKNVVEEIKDQVASLARGIPIDTSGLDDDLLLPRAALPEWSSIFQNVFINSFNAMLDSDKRLIKVSSKSRGKAQEILIQDTGCGVNLDEAETLFEPFERRIEISPERRALGYGGTGLGLTIVRMVAHNIGCEVSFVEPEKGFNTAFSIVWRDVE